MRILVFSDSHGSSRCIKEALTMHPEARAVIHLGDGERDIEPSRSLIGDKKFVAVCGNCDFYSSLPEEALEEIAGVKIFCCHGHRYGVKYTETPAVERARALGARILLYGHTHIPVTRYEDGFYIMNPGSAREGKYGIIDITPSGIICNPTEL